MSDVVIALEELKKSIGKVSGSPRKLTHASVWGSINRRHQNPGRRCEGCSSNPGRTRQQWALFQYQQNYWICGNCISKTVDKIYTQANQSGPCHKCGTNTNGRGLRWQRTGWVICENCAGTGGPRGAQVAAKIDAKIKSERKKVVDMAKKNKTIEEAAIPYINSGLAEPFAIAIARDVSLIDQILDLWEQDWWKQYPPEDILVCAVLDGELSEDDGRWLNDIRSDHERLALSCVKKEIELDWARALLDAGFLKHPEAVPDVLDGGHPVAIARIRRIKVDAELLPPQLGFKLSNASKASKKKSDEGSSLNKAHADQIANILGKLSDNQIKSITSKYVATNQRVADHKAWIVRAWKLINARKFPANEPKQPLRKVANQLDLPRRTSMSKDQLKEALKNLRTVLRRRVKSQVDAIGLDLSDYISN